MPVEALDRVLGGYGRVVVAFSGGVDSSLVAHAATRVLGRDQVLCATAVSPSLAAEEHDGARALAGEWGLRWAEVATEEMARAAYRANAPDRCFECKDALMDALVPLAADEGATVLLGVNVDDLSDHRPGQEAARRRGAGFPLVEAAMSKQDVRRAARHLGLRVWDKPAAPCLASRVPYGREVSVGVLGQVERAEAALRALGFADLRVRHYDDLARIEVPDADLDRAVQCRHEVVAAVRSAGYRYVTLDLEGLRSGNLNDSLGGAPSLRKLLITVAVLVVLYLIVDFVARGFVQGRVESEFEDARRVNAESVDFSIDSFPFLARLALLGQVSATLRLEEVQEQGIVIDEVELEVDGLEFDRDRAFRGEVTVDGIDSARGAVRFDEDTLSELLGVPVMIEEGAASAAGIEVQAQFRNGALTVAAQDVGEVTVPLDLDRYVPCAAELALHDGFVELSCTTTEVPPIVNQVLGEAVNRRGG